MANINFFVSIYIDILTKNIDNIDMYRYFFRNKKIIPPPPIFLGFLPPLLPSQFTRAATTADFYLGSIQYQWHRDGAMSGQATSDVVMAICE